MKRHSGIIHALILFFAGVLCSCVSERTVPWMKDNQNIGTIVISKRPWGTESTYKALDGRVLRTEKRNRDGRLLDGICTVQFSYDVQGNLRAEQYLSSDGNLALNPEGFAATTFAYSSDSNGDCVVEQRFYDENNQPVQTRSGFAVLRRTEAQDARVTRIQFFNLAGLPASSTWLDVPGVADVQFAYLQGVSPIVCAAFLDASGNVVERKQLSGQTTTFWGSSYTIYPLYNSSLSSSSFHR